MNLEKDPEFVAGYLRMAFIEDLYQYMHNNNVTKVQLCKKLGWTKPEFKRFLNEEVPLTEELIAEIVCKLGLRVKLTINPMNVYACVDEAPTGNLSVSVRVSETPPDVTNCKLIDMSCVGTYFLSERIVDGI
jgi:hypothetical protein